MKHPGLPHPRLVGLLLCLATGCATVRPEASPQFKTYASVGDRPYPIISSNLDGDGVASGRVEPERPGRGPGVLAGRVVDSRGRPIAGAVVRLASDGASRGRLNTTETDQSGGFTLRGLRSGASYTLIAEYQDGDAVYTRRIEAEAPDERVRIKIDGDDAEAPTYASAPRPSISRASTVRKGSSEGRSEVAIDSRPRVNAADVEPPPAHEADAVDGPDPRAEAGPFGPPAVSTRKAKPAGGWRASGSSTIEDDPLDDGPVAEADPIPGRGRPEPRVSARRTSEGDDDLVLPPAIERPEPSRGPAPVLTEPPRPSTPRAQPRPEPEPAAEPSRTVQPVRRAPPILDFSDRTPPGSTTPSPLPDPDPAPDPVPAPAPDPAPAAPVLPAQPPVEPVQPAPPIEPAVPAPTTPEPAPAPSPEPAPAPSPEPAPPIEPVVPGPQPEALPDSAPPSEPEPAQTPTPGPVSPGPPAVEPPVVEPPVSSPSPSPEPVPSEGGLPAEPAAKPPGDETETANLGPRTRIRWGQLALQDRGPIGPKSALEPEARRASAILSGSKLKRGELYEPEPATASVEPPAARRGEVLCKLDPTAKRVVALQAPDILGRDVRLADLDSDLVLLDFWGTWCSPCRDAIPHLVELQKTYGPKRLRVLGIAYEQVPAERRTALVAETGRKLGVNYPLLLGLSDTPCPIRDAFRVQVYPTMILLDRQGRILWRQEGATPQNLARLERAIAIALQERTADSVRR